ncbi:MAG: amino acid ABC transporter substrate-binding protein [Rhodospirillaceae bacterium]
MKALGLVTVLLAGLLTAPSAHASSERLQIILEDGVVRCGVHLLGPGLSHNGADGRWSGFFPDICRAIAAAVLSDEEAVEFVITGTADRFDGLIEDRYDVLVEPATWTLSRDRNDLTFMPMYLFDGQSFLFYKPSGIKTLQDLKGKRICVQDHTTSIANLTDYNESYGMDLEILPFDTMAGNFSAFFERQCDAISTDVLLMASMRQALAPNPDEYDFVPERISKEPLSAVVHSGDPLWEDVVRWVMFALINAEELGITSENLTEMKTSSNPDVRYFLGLEGNNGAALGLDERWAERIVRAVGNYGEIYDRSIGAELGLERGLNALWTDGGLIWSPPMR